ncbi:hypothetical protein IC582_003267 [Cucumis melo]
MASGVPLCISFQFCLCFSSLKDRIEISKRKRGEDSPHPSCLALATAVSLTSPPLFPFCMLKF